MGTGIKEYAELERFKQNLVELDRIFSNREAIIKAQTKCVLDDLFVSDKRLINTFFKEMKNAITKSGDKDSIRAFRKFEERVEAAIERLNNIVEVPEKHRKALLALDKRISRLEEVKDRIEKHIEYIKGL